MYCETCGTPLVMDVSQTLKDVENALRDFIAQVLHESLGDEWVARCGVSNERIEKWTERREVESKRQDTGTVEERIIYYADFYDLKSILHRNWSGEFSKAFGEWKTMEVYLTLLEKFRDPDAHRRELLSHQKHLIIGIGGEIRNKIIQYRSKNETGEDYFPRIESARDNFGNMWIPGRMPFCSTNVTLRVGDILEFVVTASDPQGLELEYQIAYQRPWQKDNTIQVLVEDEHIGRLAVFAVQIRSPRSYHAENDSDGTVRFGYTVLPKMVETP